MFTFNLKYKLNYHDTYLKIFKDKKILYANINYLSNLIF